MFNKMETCVTRARSLLPLPYPDPLSFSLSPSMKILRRTSWPRVTMTTAIIHLRMRIGSIDLAVVELILVDGALDLAGGSRSGRDGAQPYSEPGLLYLAVSSVSTVVLLALPCACTRRHPLVASLRLCNIPALSSGWTTNFITLQFDVFPRPIV